METVTGIFQSRRDAEKAVHELATKAEFKREDLLLLTPDSAPEKADMIRTDEGEQPGMGSTIGGVVGGAVGLAAGAVLSNLVLPGVGPILMLTLSAGGGLGGALAGAAGGSAAERALSMGLPKDEVFFYEDALRHCHVVLMAMADSEEMANRARSILQRNGADSVDAAREKWWIGIRDGEALEFGGAQGEFERAEDIYRAGFEAALGPELRGRSFSQAEADLRARFPDIYASECFRRGYERGSEYLKTLRRNGESAPPS